MTEHEVHSQLVPTRGRPRDAQRGKEILRATQELLVEHGFEELSMDAVAARAGASKATLYRRWPSKDELVAAALEGFAWDAPVPDTGDLRSDLVALGSVWFDSDEGRDQLYVRLVTSLLQDDRLHGMFLSRLAEPRRVAFTEIVTRAAERGEVADLDAALRFGGILPALAFQQIAVSRSAVDRAFLEHVIDDILLPLLTGVPRAH